MLKIKGFKFIQENMSSKNGKHFWKVGEWYKERELKICEKGFHACLTPQQSLNYIYGDKWFIVEARGKIIHEDDKFVASEMRLIKEIPIIVIKRFALFCAKQCLKNYEKEYPNDKRVSDCIKATEDYLDGKITLKELSAAESAAWSAELAASSTESAAWSASSTAESAANSAAESLSSAASSAELAAWSAELAASSAELAASSAELAASSAESAAWSAAWSARSAAKSAQNKELLKLIKEYTK